jgi:hypothetical protein
MQEAAVQPFNAAAVNNPPDCRHRIPIGPMSALADEEPLTADRLERVSSDKSVAPWINSVHDRLATRAACRSDLRLR